MDSLSETLRNIGNFPPPPITWVMEGRASVHHRHGVALTSVVAPSVDEERKLGNEHNMQDDKNEHCDGLKQQRLTTSTSDSRDRCHTLYS